MDNKCAFVLILLALIVAVAAKECVDTLAVCQTADCRKSIFKTKCCRTCSGPNPPTGGPPIYTKGPRNCGNKDSTKNSGPGAWPWQALIFYKNYQACSGTIVSDRHIVTAAHCIPALLNIAELVVRVGDYDVHVSEGYERTFKVTNVFVHGGYSGVTREKDIAVLKLSTPIQFNSHVQQICLPLDDIKASSECYSLGWRKELHEGQMHTVLKEAKLSSVDNAVCKSQFPNHIIFDTMICAGNPSVSSRKCHGKFMGNGGGLVCKSGAHWVLHGVLSYDHDDCRDMLKWRNLNSVFTRVRSFGSWVLEVKSK